MTTEDPDLSKDDDALDAMQLASRIDITEFIISCATNHLSVKEPFLSDADNIGIIRDDSVRSKKQNGSAKGETFNLHDAMAASQLMDKKMDCCEVPASLISPWLFEDTTTSTDHSERMIFPRPIPTGLYDVTAPLPWDDLTIQSTALICMEILVRFQALLTGSSVGESTFTCLYAHAAVLNDMKMRLNADVSLSSLVESVQQINLSDGNHELNHRPTETTIAQWSVFACALALVELTDSVREIILNADIYEEEDFAVVTHNIPFFTSCDPTNNSASGGGDLVDAVDILESVLQMVHQLPLSEYATILQLVLGYQWNLLHIFSSMTRLHGGVELQPTMASVQNIVHLAVQRLTDIHILATKFVENGVYESEDMKLILQRSFDSYVIRPLVGNIPIRKISFHPPANSIELLRTVTSELDSCVCAILIRGTTLSRIQRMLDRTCHANILCRSLLLLNLYFDENVFGRYDLRDLLLKDMHQLQYCPFIKADDDVFYYLEQSSYGNLMAETIVTLLNRLAKPIYDSLKVRILNRNRQRTFLELVLLPEWVSLQHEAHIVDARIQQQQHVDHNSAMTVPPPSSPFFTRYVLSVQIRLMDRFIEAGIELCLFRCIHCDISFALWYRDYLLSALHLQLSSMHQSKESDIATNAVPAVEAKEPKAKGSNKKKHHNTLHKNSGYKNGKQNGGDSRVAIAQPLPRQPSVAEMEDAHELKVIALKRNLCRKTIQYMAVLSQAGVLEEKQFEFTSLEHIFVKRFEVFQKMQQPPPLTYDHYLEGMNFSNVSIMDLIPAVSDGFQHCRAAIEHLLSDITDQKLDSTFLSMNEADLRSLIKVCVGNTVYVQRMKQLVERAMVHGGNGLPVKAKIRFDFESNNQFCIIKVEAL
jgi:Mak10 subunit, NatC N(alpha)-terminal acetyltransferase